MNKSFLKSQKYYDCKNIIDCSSDEKPLTSHKQRWRLITHLVRLVILSYWGLQTSYVSAIVPHNFYIIIFKILITNNSYVRTV